MGGTEPPFMYTRVKKDDERFPPASFDPKAVTRASYEKKKAKPKPNGPLVSINRHPEYEMPCLHSVLFLTARRPHSTADCVGFWTHANSCRSAHMAPTGRSRFKPMSLRTKGWIKGMRVVQLCLRVLEAVAAAGLIVAMVLSELIGWVTGVAVGSQLADHQCRS